MRGAAPLVLAAAVDPALLVPRILAAWAEGRPVALAAPVDRQELEGALGDGTDGPAWGASAVLGSGGSSGRRRWCLQPLAHLEASAAATADFLVAQGLDPAACLHLNPLPLHHVSGLLPLVRARQWGAQLGLLPAEWMRDPDLLAQASPLPTDRPVVVSLVPTQLTRLMATAAGVAWLRRCAVIWVGGAALAPALATRARQLGLRLSPCYGATETAAMVCALAPDRFLAGESGCGPALVDVSLRLDGATGAVEVRTARLASGWLEAGRLMPLALGAGGWWRSGDAGRLDPGGWTVLGRLDGALQSGAETVFPEELEGRLAAAAQERGLPLEAVLLLGLPEAEWGERMLALVRPQPGADGAVLIAALEAITATWRPADRPRRWRLCGELAPNAAGKWERSRWRCWFLGT
jgi:O-succinylbenzoic acid--CoA ligase